jgi:hypothetical protein
MSQSTMACKSVLFAAATAMTAAGFLTVPSSAHADPACSQYQIVGDFALKQSNGYRVEFSATGQGFGGDATATPLSGGAAMKGTVSGSISGRHLDFTIRWNSGPRGHYIGDVGDDDFAHGLTFDEANAGSQANWDSTVPLQCATAAAPAPQAPAQPAPPQQAPAGQKVATVTNDVDVYNLKNEPDGTGTVIGMLRSGRQVQYLGSCAQSDWCNVIVPELPGGRGWIWGNLQF